MIILAIETSCDETAVSVVEFKNQKVKVLAEVVSSQVKLHARYGGVVPMLAAREHLKNFVPVLRRALRQAEKNCRDADLSRLLQTHDLSRLRTRDKSRLYGIDYIAVTNGPGLIPALITGVSAAKALAYAWQKPLIPIHHIEGHIYANWLGKSIKSNVRKVESSYDLWEPEFPVLCLIVSGGHTQLILMKKNLSYKIIGETLDDATGEAFDKVAKLLGLEYPGGPIIEKLAKHGDKNKFKFPRPMISSGDFNFSFSGLKTAVLYKWKLENKDRTNRTDKAKADVAASFQQAAFDVLISKTITAAKKYKVKNILLGGGVSANKELQRQFKKAVKTQNVGTQNFVSLQTPTSKLSTDNATMIAIAAYYRIINNKNIKDWKSVKADAGLVL